MSRSTILIVDADAEAYRRRFSALSPDLDIRVALDSRTAKAQCGDVNAIVGFNNVFDEELLKAAENLSWVQLLSTGADRILSLRPLIRDVVVTSTRGVHGPPVSEMAFFHMLMLARDGRRLIENQRNRHWEILPQPLLHGKTVAIVGVGTIAVELAQRCRSFGMRVVGLSRTPRTEAGFDSIHPLEQLHAVASTADFLVLLVPLSGETRHLIDENVLRVMKPTAHLVNLARGGVCDEEAVLSALRQDEIAGAGFDVFDSEPLPPDHPLWSERRVVITPHLAGMTDCYPDLVWPILEKNTICFLEKRWADMVNIVQ